jgi:nucleoside-diphosphate-sugar epimerase
MTQSPQESVFVTGASGFLGGTLVEALHFAGQYRVHAGIARWVSTPRIARLAVPLVQCDVLRPQELAEALSRMDYVIHCAVSDDLRVIVDGTANVLRAAKQVGAKRVVHISSSAVYGEATGTVDEDTPPPDGTLSAYGEAKRAAEALCRDAATGLDIVVLRPTIIYGPFSARWTMLNAVRLKARLWKRLGPLGQGKCNLVHVNDVVRYAVAALTHDNVVGGVFNVNGPDVVTWDEYFERFNRHLGLPAMAAQPVGRTRRQVRATGVLRAIGKYALKHHQPLLLWLSNNSTLLRQRMQQTELMLRCTPNSDEMALFRLDAKYLTGRAESAFGFRSNIDLDRGLATTAAWLDFMGEPAI